MPTFPVQVEVAVRHALQEAARRSEGSMHRRSEAGDSVHSNGSGGDSVRDGMSFRQVGPAGAPLEAAAEECLHREGGAWQGRDTARALAGSAGAHARLARRTLLAPARPPGLPRSHGLLTSAPHPPPPAAVPAHAARRLHRLPGAVRRPARQLWLLRLAGLIGPGQVGRGWGENTARTVRAACCALVPAVPQDWHPSRAASMAALGEQVLLYQGPT